MIFLKNCCVGHIPKCAGRFVRECLLSGVNSLGKDIPNAHHAHLTPDVEKTTGVIFFVRHPCSWLKSLHAHRMEKGWNWDLRYDLEKKCKSPEFEKFVLNVCEHENIIFDYFESYIEKYRSNDLKIGKVENITHDLLEFLCHFKEDFNEDVIKKMKPYRINNYTKNLTISKEVAQKLYDTQFKYYNTYFYEA